MKLLLDTHSFLWFIMGSERLSAKAKFLIEDINNQKFISIASVWEMAIKVSLGKLTLEKSFAEIIPSQIHSNGFGILDLKLEHAMKVSELPFFHRDPFDRLLIAQALTEQIAIVSLDTKFDSYQTERFW